MQQHLLVVLLVQVALEAEVLVLKETGAGELLAQELGDAQQALGEITGRFHSEDLLGAIFSSFCIGK